MHCRDASDYFQRFEGYLEDAGLSPTDRLVLEWAKRGTHPRIKESIHRTPGAIPDTYEEWKECALQLDENWLTHLASEPRRADQGARPNARAAGPTRQPPPHPALPQQQQQQQQQQQLPPPPRPGQARADPTGILYEGRGQPMDIDCAAAGAALCFRCGRRRFEGGDCPNRWHRAPGGLPTQQPRAPQPYARVRAVWEDEAFRTQVQEWARQDPDSFQAAGFGTGVAEPQPAPPP